MVHLHQIYRRSRRISLAISVDIKKRFGSFVLDVQFEADNEVLTLFGASGCGKSTILKCIAGILKPDSGRIVLDGKVLFDSEKRINLSPQKRNVGYIFQQYALFPNMTVEQNIACGLHGRKDAEKIAGIIHAMHLDGMNNKYPSQLSGGQQQRTALARILIGDPDILMLDEPFSALDTHLRYQMEKEVKSTIESYGRSVLLVSHDKDEVYRLSDRVALMKDGIIEVLDRKKDVFNNPRTVNGAQLTGYRNISAVRPLGDGRVYAVDWGAELEVEGDTEGITHIGVRTQSVRLGESGNMIRCRIEEVIANPYSYTVMVCPENDRRGTTFDITVSRPKWELTRGTNVIVSIPKEEIVLLRG